MKIDQSQLLKNFFIHINILFYNLKVIFYNLNKIFYFITYFLT